MRRVLAGCSCSWSRETLELRFTPGASSDLIESKLGSPAEALARIAWRPLTPRLVATALAISGQERVRWTKDGRLPHSGQAVARRGSLLSIPTYSVEAIENLAAHPEISRLGGSTMRRYAHDRSSYKHILISHLTVGSAPAIRGPLRFSVLLLWHGAKREAGVKPELPPQL